MRDGGIYLDMDAIQMLWILRRMRDPEHLDGIHVQDVGVAGGGGTDPGIVTRDAKYIMHAHHIGTHKVGLQATARLIPGSHLKHRISTQFSSHLAAGHAGHAGAGRGTVCEIDGCHHLFHHFNVPYEFTGGGTQGGGYFGGDHKFACPELFLKVRKRFLVPRRVVLGITLPPAGLADRLENGFPGM